MRSAHLGLRELELQSVTDGALGLDEQTPASLLDEEVVAEGVVALSDREDVVSVARSPRGFGRLACLAFEPRPDKDLSARPTALVRSARGGRARPPLPFVPTVR